MLIVADGRKLNMIDYETARVDSWPIGRSPLGVILNPNPDLSKVAKVGGAPSGLLLQGWTVVDAQNNRTIVKLSAQRFNVPVADSAFTFQRPVKGRKG